MTGKEKPALDRMLLGNIKAYTSTEKKTSNSPSGLPHLHGCVRIVWLALPSEREGLRIRQQVPSPSSILLKKQSVTSADHSKIRRLQQFIIKCFWHKQWFYVKDIKFSILLADTNYSLEALRIFCRYTNARDSFHMIINVV